MPFPMSSLSASPRVAGLLLVLVVLASGAAAQSKAAAQEPPLLQDPSLDELRMALVPPTMNSRGLTFRRTEPPTTDGVCPGTGATAVGRNLEVVPMPSTDAPRVNLAVQFSTGKDQLSDQSQRMLDRVAQVLREPGADQARFAIAGHADATGPRRLNLELSCARSIAVRRYLVDHGKVAPHRLTAYGFGSDQPLEPGVKESAANRRVEVRRVD